MRGIKGIPFSYSLRNLWTRRLTTILTISGMALVVFVFTTILMLAEGLRKTLVETGSYDNVVIIRKGSGSEVQSWIDRAQAGIIETDPLVSTGQDGKPLVAREVVVLIALPKKDTGKVSNVTIRGISESSLALRPQVSLVRGRMPRMGSSEVAVGASVARRFKDADLGGELRFGMRQWRIVGIFDAGNTGFTSEIWGDVEQLMPAFRRPVFSSVIFRMSDPSQFEMLKTRIETNPRLTQEVKRETRYYLEQSEMMAKFLRILGLSLTMIFSLGAIIGAMITMYAAVANRINEIGTLRALGFKRGAILTSFLMEAMLLGLAGGLTGIFFASFMELVTVSTVNFQTFSELAFKFSLTADIVIKAFSFAIIMGFMGGVLPAIRAAHMNIVEALRTK
ncbi:MAG: ABC transporter permease [Syntrophorhabdaceae bacterium]